MIIELQNFGPIKSFKFDTSKDMHAIFGKNNIGKSYAISAVYLILKNLNSYQHLVELRNDTAVIESNFINRSNDNQEYIFDNEVTELFKKSFDTTFISALTNSLKNTFEFHNIQNVNGENLSIELCFPDYLITINLDKENKKLFTETFTFSYNYILQNSDTEIKPLTTGNDLIFYRNINTSTIKNLDMVVYYLHEVISRITSDNFEDIYILPASRSGLYNALNSFGAIFAELSRNRNFIRNKIEIPNISEPISDYFLNLNTIDKTQANEHYLKHFEEIEQDILKGKITLDDETKKYYYVPTDTEMRLELSFTSSMISEIAPVIAHLKYIIPLESDKPSILFIEEPEAHLHPEIQILLLEYFVKLSKGNVKIVMTSHSNYIFNKLSNLLIAKKIDKNKLSVSLMKMTPEGSVIEEGAMQMDEYGIEDNNFVDVAEQLYEERMSLLEKL